MKIVITSKTLSKDKGFVDEVSKIFAGYSVDVNLSDSLKGQDLVSFVKDADYVVLGTEKFTRGVIDSCYKLRAVFKYGVGLDNVDIDYLKEKSIPVYWAKGTNSQAVAEICIAYMILLLRNQPKSQCAAKMMSWDKQNGRELHEATFGIIGYGNVGKTVSKLLQGLGADKILVNDVRDISKEVTTEKIVSIDELLRASDVVTLHIDNEKGVNDNFIDDDKFKMMKNGSIFINTARGSIVDYSALERQCLRFGGIGLDVYPDEPIIPSVLTYLENSCLSCHICGSSNSAIERGKTFLYSAMINHLSKEKR
jgi:D-3-phosphoglycerate dehydrogenase